TIAQRLLDAFSEPVRTTAGDIAVWASIGIHVSTEDDDYDSLLRSADTAMYDAKRTGDGGISFFALPG
ncbi:MAG: Diguanylate cyclase, domain, partial [Actinomycetota bacterium]|nr:Diguanylate cyclase, domain [Actinomycetota bacterium]